MKNPKSFGVLFTGIFLLFLSALVLILLMSNVQAASSIYGTVTDSETEDPIEKADVVIYNREDRNDTQKTQTDSNGDYEVIVDPGHYTIKISKEGYETHTDEVDVGPEEQVEHDAELKPEEETYLEGYITDANTSDPIIGANITVSDRKSKFTGTTDRQGYYNISCKEGEYGIKITHEEYEIHEDRISIEAGANLYNAGLTPNSSRTNDGRDDNNGDNDDDGFNIAGGDGLMISGWIVAGILIVLLVIQTKKRETEKVEDQIRTPQNKPPDPPKRSGEGPGKSSEAMTRVRPLEDDEQLLTGKKSSCPQCNGKGQYLEKYKDHYCWECKEYFKELK